MILLMPSSINVQKLKVYNNTGLLVDIKFLLSCSTRREIPYLCAPMYDSLYINSYDDSTVGVIKHLTRQMCYL